MEQYPGIKWPGAIYAATDDDAQKTADSIAGQCGLFKIKVSPVYPGVALNSGAAFCTDILPQVGDDVKTVVAVTGASAITSNTNRLFATANKDIAMGLVDRMTDLSALWLSGHSQSWAELETDGCQLVVPSLVRG